MVIAKKIFWLALILSISMGGAFWVNRKLTTKVENSAQDKLRVVTTLYPLYDFANSIGRDKIKATLLLPAGVEPHAFEPKLGEVMIINEADVFVYTGKLMEVWAEDVLAGVTNKDLKVVDASEGIEIEENDPHIWLDFDKAAKMVESITQALVEKDPTNRDFYLTNARDYQKSLAQLDSDYKNTLANCRSNEIVYGGHYALGYLTKRYGLEYTAAQGLSPDAEPTTNDLILLVNQIRKNNLKYIYFEELTSPKIAETLAKETGVKLLPLSAAHNVAKDDLSQGISYLSIMRGNLANIELGLECGAK